jgi:hypothetical protein
LTEIIPEVDSDSDDGASKKAQKTADDHEEETVKKATAARFRCTHVHANGTRCKKTYKNKKGMSNHIRTHGKTKPGKTKPSRKAVLASSKNTQVEKDLKLTVTRDAYKAMTARKGEKGKKKKEIRKAGQVWIESRLDGRVYETVKLYGGVPGFYETAPWTRFVCLGYSEAGSVGEEYVVENMGEGEGWELVYDGVVWEIHLGEVLERNFIAPWQESEPEDEEDEDIQDSVDLTNHEPPPPWVPPSPVKRNGRKSTVVDSTPQSSSASPQGLMSMDQMTSMATLFASTQKPCMDIITEMMRQQEKRLGLEMAKASAAAERVNPMYSLNNVQSWKDMFGK